MQFSSPAPNDKPGLATFKYITNKVMYQRLYDNMEITRVDLRKIDFGAEKFKYVSLNRGEQKYPDITDQAKQTRNYFMSLFARQNMQ